MAGIIVADTLQDGAGNSTAMDNAIYGSAKAWVQFDGTAGSITPRSSYNVSSVTKASTSNFTITFTNALVDANFCVVGFCGTTGNTSNNSQIVTTNPINSSSAFISTNNGGNSANSYNCTGVVVFR